MTKSTKKPSTDKPAKPYADFTLYPHASGRWAKRIRGKIHYFGRWRDVPGDGWQAALDLFHEQRDDLYAGRVPRKPTEGCPVADLCGSFLDHKKARRTTGAIAPRTFTDYHATCDRVVRVFGKTRYVEDLTGHDFELLRADISQTRGAVATSTEIIRARSIFKAFKEVVVAAGIKRQNAGFYDLRRTFQTIGEEISESVTRYIMGHCDPSMSARYRQRVYDDRLRAVVDVVRAWLWPAPPPKPTASTE